MEHAVPEKQPKTEHGFMLVSYYDEKGNHCTKKVPTLIQRGGKPRAVTPEMRNELEARRAASLAEQAAGIKSRKSAVVKSKRAPERKRAA